MALQIKTIIKGKAAPSAYVCVRRLVVDKFANFVKAEIFIYENQMARTDEKEPIDTLEVTVPFSDTPFAPVYDELKKLFMEFTEK